MTAIAQTTPAVRTPLVEVAAEEAVDVLATTAHPCLQLEEIREDVNRVLAAALPHIAQGLAQELEARAYLAADNGDNRTAVTYRNVVELIGELTGHPAR